LYQRGHQAALSCSDQGALGATYTCAHQQHANILNIRRPVQCERAVWRSWLSWLLLQQIRLLWHLLGILWLRLCERALHQRGLQAALSCSHQGALNISHKGADGSAHTANRSRNGDIL
jgi:hypothetical protein